MSCGSKRTARRNVRTSACDLLCERGGSFNGRLPECPHDFSDDAKPIGAIEVVVDVRALAGIGLTPVINIVAVPPLIAAIAT
jgi:hypothetical protein